MDRVFGIRLKSFGFLHSGREPLRVQVLKRAWPFLPGSTLYGALAAALIRLDGGDRADPSGGDGGYHDLLRLVEAQAIRFTPLLPVKEEEEEDRLTTAMSYCQRALELQQAAEGTRDERLFFSTPHAPINRQTMQIHQDQLFALAVHQPWLEYRGFVFTTAAGGELLRRGLRMLPFLPLGGKGKFTAAEAEVSELASLASFESELRGSLEGNDVWVRLLTPMVLQGGDNWLLDSAEELQRATPLRRYRVWRTGVYYDPLLKEYSEYGLALSPQEQPGRAHPGGEVSAAVSAVPDGSRFRLNLTEPLAAQLAQRFVRGAGHPAWTYLGWGQVVIENGQ